MASVCGNTLCKNVFIKGKQEHGVAVDRQTTDKMTVLIMWITTVLIGLIAAPVAFVQPENLTDMLWATSGTIMSAVAGPVCVGIYSK